MVEVTRLELTTSWSRTKRATNCATPRNDNLYGAGGGNRTRVVGLGSRSSAIEPHLQGINHFNTNKINYQLFERCFIQIVLQLLIAF